MSPPVRTSYRPPEAGIKKLIEPRLGEGAKVDSVKEIHPKFVLLSEGGAIKRVDLPSDAGATSTATALPVIQPVQTPPPAMPAPQVQMQPAPAMQPPGTVPPAAGQQNPRPQNNPGAPNNANNPNPPNNPNAIGPVPGFGRQQ